MTYHLDCFLSCDVVFGRYEDSPEEKEEEKKAEEKQAKTVEAKKAK